MRRCVLLLALCLCLWLLRSECVSGAHVRRFARRQPGIASSPTLSRSSGAGTVVVGETCADICAQKLAICQQNCPSLGCEWKCNEEAKVCNANCPQEDTLTSTSNELPQAAAAAAAPSDTASPTPLIATTRVPESAFLRAPADAACSAACNATLLSCFHNCSSDACQLACIDADKSCEAYCDAPAGCHGDCQRAAINCSTKCAGDQGCMYRCIDTRSSCDAYCDAPAGCQGDCQRVAINCSNACAGNEGCILGCIDARSSCQAACPKAGTQTHLQQQQERVATTVVPASAFTRARVSSSCSDACVQTLQTCQQARPSQRRERKCHRKLQVCQAECLHHEML